MADELDATLNEPSEAEKRIKQLSGKLKEEAEAKEAERSAREAAEKKSQEVERERDFFAGFADTVIQNPAAKDFKDDIKAKVMSGYSLEDATFAVLGKAGKLSGPTVSHESPAGGSATTTPPSGTQKTAAEMSLDEKRAILEKELLWQ